ILGYDDCWTRCFAAAGLKQPTSVPAYSVDTSMAALALVSANAGCAAILTRFARQATLAHHQIGMIGDPVPFSHVHYIARPKTRRKQKPESRLFEDWLKRRFSAEP
ncbi:hypothetical protein R0K19_21010, partial [Bacillus sp. SIMBA_161]